MSEIEKFFAGKNVFVTGVTGFVGKVLVEKLLRSCKSIGKVFVLVRTKRNEDPETRFKKLVEHVIFSTLRATQPAQLEKLKFICGDVAQDGLGISSFERNILVNEVDVIFHCAACVKFDLSLLDIMKINVEGTHRLLVLATEMTRLKAFTFVSTAFSQSYQTTLDEKHYPTGLDLPSLLKAIEMNDSETIEEMQKILFTKKHPTTYTMSKAIAEDLVFSFRGKIPIAIVRPSIVVSTYCEPEKGFIEGLQGISGAVASICAGLNHFLWQGDVTIHIVPVDFTVNTIIAATYEKASKQNAPTFYNSTVSTSNCITFWEFGDLCRNVLVGIPPLNNVFWYPYAIIISNHFLYFLLILMLQLIPGLMFDAVRVLSGKKPFLTKIQWKIYKLMVIFARFTTIQYDINIDNTKKLFDGLTDDDQKKFMFDADQIVWHEQVESYMRGIRKHLLQESDDTLPDARKQLKRLFWIDLSVKTAIGIVFLWCCFQLLF